MNILFVCTGNTCRSPMAEAILRKKLPKVNVQSAGVFASPNSPATQEAVTALKEKSITLDHKAQIVNEVLLKWADIVLTMTESHKQTLVHFFPQYEEKYYTLIEYSIGETKQDKDIADPYGGDLSLYRLTANEIEQYIDQLIKKIDMK